MRGEGCRWRAGGGVQRGGGAEVQKWCKNAEMQRGGAEVLVLRWCSRGDAGAEVQLQRWCTDAEVQLQRWCTDVEVWRYRC